MRPLARPLGVLVLITACAPPERDTGAFAPGGTRSRSSYTAHDATLTGTGPGEAFGAAVAVLGDVDADGFSDLGVGAPDVGSGAGRVVLYSGMAVAAGGTIGAMMDGAEVGAGFGEALSAAGDVNADGYDDVAVSAPRAGGTGVVYIYLGSASGPSAAPAQALSVGTDADGFGAAVAGGCDVSGDGLPDLLVGAPRYAGATGRAYVFLGTGDGFADTPALALDGAGPAATFGASVACAGDLDADGVDDFAVGAPGLETGGSGYVDVHLGSLGGPAASPSVTLQVGLGVDGFGFAVAGAGDVDGDGVDDLVVGAPLVASDSGDPASGWGGVFAGGSGGPGPVPVSSLDGPSATGWFGASVAGVGDLGLDGRSEFLVGSPSADGSAGVATLPYASPRGLPGMPDRGLEPTPLEFRGTGSGQRVGVALAAGDFDGDGIPDLAIGAPGVGSSQGEVRLWWGRHWGADDDGDGWEVPDDCDDGNSRVRPYVKDGDCDGNDDDCDGEVDEDHRHAQNLYYDDDLDGFGRRGLYTSFSGCEDSRPGYTERPGDCDDGDDSINPNAFEACDGIDNDCNGVTDDATRSIHFVDADGDGYGDPATPVTTCGQTGVANGWDADDTDPAVH